VSDRHPVSKRDKPSATARELARICQAVGVDRVDIASYREGPPVSDHWVTLTRGEETLTFTHATRDLGAAAHGALRAARWVKAAGPRVWSMADVWQAFAETDDTKADPASNAGSIAEKESRS
jgi:4-hydroxy-tetrahydrodipicolinate reductase